MWNLVKLPVVMRNTQDITILHANAEGDCYSGSGQRVTLLLFKRHFLIWRNWVNQYAVATEAIRDSRHNREWVPSPKRNPQIKIKALVLLIRVEASKNLQGKILALFPREIEGCGYFKERERHQSLKINIWTSEYISKVNGSFWEWPVSFCVCARACTWYWQCLLHPRSAVHNCSLLLTLK